MIAEACTRYEPDFYLIDVETEVEGDFGGARMFINALRPSVPGLPLELNSFGTSGCTPLPVDRFSS